MKKILAGLMVTACAAAAWAAGNDDAKAQFNALEWHKGPSTENVVGHATLKIDKNLMFLDEKNSTQFLKLTGNVPEPGNNILLSEQERWWAAFSFNPIGHVNDDEKIDADALLKQLKDSDGPSNEERKTLGIAPLYTEGWYVMPHYDTATKRLEWGVKLRSGDHISLNYTIRLLGRTGVMSATLVSDPEHLDADMKAFKTSLEGFEFVSGERYSEFREGDKVAAYGLGALIAGGAVAVAAKKGFFPVLAAFFASSWKFILLAVAGAGTWLRSLFKRKS